MELRMEPWSLSTRL